MVDIMVALWFAELTSQDRVSVKPHASPVLHAINYLLGDLDERYLADPARQGRPAVLPQPAQGPRHRRLLDRLGRDRRHRRAVGGDGAPLRALAVPRRRRRRAGSSACSGTPSSTRARSGRPWPTRRSPGWASCCGWSTSTGSRWTGWCPTSRSPTAAGDVRGRRMAGRHAQVGPAHLRAVRPGPAASCSGAAGGDAQRGVPADAAGRLRRGRRADRDRRRRATGGRCAARPRDRHARRRAGGRGPRPRRPRPRAARRHLHHGRRPTAPRWCSPTRSRAAGCRPRATRTTTPPCSPATRWTPWRPPPGWSAARPVAAVRRRTALPGGSVQERGAALRREPVTPTTPLRRAHLARPRRTASRSRPRPPSAGCWPTFRATPRRRRRAWSPAAPDVASSTNLGGWINKTGVWSVADRRDWFADDTERVLRWHEVTNGQHIELGIAEVNLVCLLGELGATWSRWGERLIPIATLYDPFVSRALEPWSYGIYAGGQSILVGTPSGVTLAPEGGAHQSITTPSIGLEQPGCVAWEPAFAHGPGVVPPARDGAGRGRGRHLGLLPPLDAADRSRPRPAAG